MDTRKGEVITRREIDAMGEEELLALVRRHSKLLGERFPKRAEQFYCPDILDEPHLLWRLYQLDRERFIEMVREQNKREYIAGGHWAAVLLSMGEALPSEILRRQEQVMFSPLTEGEYIRPLSLESALFLEVSEKARQIWTSQHGCYACQKTKCEHLTQAMVMRKTWLNVSHLDSAKVFYRLGWTPLDVMLAYLLGETCEHILAVDPDCAADAARRDPEAAVHLMDQDSYKEYFGNRFHPSYFEDMAQTWREILYLQYNWPDLTPLEQGHRLKKADAHCRLVLNRLRNSDWRRQEFELELRKAGLLTPEIPLEWDSPKLAKVQRLALTRAMVYHYQWRAGDLLAAMAASPKPEIFTGLIWGIYRENRLETVFLLTENGIAWGEDEEPLALPENASIGLVVPAELTKQQLALWKRRLKDVGGKPPIRQTALPAQPPKWEDFEGAVTRHITLYTASGKWGLDMGSLPVHCRADLLDPLHGYGARIAFETVWNGSEYNENDVSIFDVTFFRMDSLPFDDCLPPRAVLPPKELPARFLSLAGAAFRQLTGLK